MELLKTSVTGFLILAAAGLVNYFIVKYSAAYPEQKFWRKDSKTDFSYWLLSVYVFTYIIGMLVTLIMGTATYISPAFMERINSAIQPDVTIGGVIMGIILLDFLGYWMHRLSHKPLFWKFHAVHHSPEEIDWLSSLRFHPAEAVVIVSIIFSTCILAGLDPATTALALSIRSVYGYLVHANSTWNFGILGYVFASPYFHRWHHTKETEGLDKNFAGVFSAWDFIFGTAYFPKNLQPHNFGVDDKIQNTLLGHLKYPFPVKKP